MRAQDSTRPPIQALSAADRHCGALLRSAVARSAPLESAAQTLATVMSPAFRALVAVAILWRPTRAAGLRALAASVGGAIAARVLRDRIGRRRPGPRDEGGFPSRHAAAATAIAATAARHHPGPGRVLLAVAAMGMVARVASADHEPADIAAGAALGWMAAAAVAALADDR